MDNKKQNNTNSKLVHLRKGEENDVRLHLRHQGDKGILIINASRILNLNSTATFFVDRILNGISDEKIVAELREKYRVSKTQALNDLKSLKDLIHELSTTDDICPIHNLQIEESNMADLALNAPLRMDLALTYRCNNNCDHCYNQPDSPNAKELDTVSWKKILERLWNLGIPHVAFTGGEPTLRDDLYELIDHAENIGIVTGLITNGRKLFKEDYTNRLVAAGLDHIQITFESSDEKIHNRMVGNEHAWQETVQGIKNAVKTPIYTLTNTTLTKINNDTILETIEFLHDLEVEQFACNSIIYAGKGKNMSPIALTEEELVPILESIADLADDLDMNFIWYTPTRYCELDPVNLGLGVKRCSASHLAMAIEPNGTVIPCQSYYEGLGNILNDSWDSIWNHKLSKSLRSHSSAPEECRDCSQLDLCGGGCPLSYYREDYVCPGSNVND